MHGSMRKNRLCKAKPTRVSARAQVINTAQFFDLLGPGKISHDVGGSFRYCMTPGGCTDLIIHNRQ